MRSETLWEAKKRQNPGHSAWYISRFEEMREQGKDLDGEARLIDAMLPRGARILDAGCGPGRVGGELARRGHRVVGVDVDPELIEAARQDFPDLQWFVGDLAELDLPAEGITEPFDLIVCAGNVMTFLAPGTAVDVLTRMRGHLTADGRVVIGFGGNRGYAFEAFFDDAATAGLEVQQRFSTWDLRPFNGDSDFLVAVLGRA
ncbi:MULTISPECIES: class I SAM-dependent methyltransferase [unclassified Arthrobacter]|uniref:class I SAM-dependent methyltransferase n=1 Tax=unclassified Arthrobacter TaxID=235627 RepID=UPI001E5AA0BA|nr:MULTISPECIES: class I SAM-dependent methyltransferase [unclassified Arthrobacter]MCC9146797.1 class I SAM-dependent methyltransferase [Arthrobacter sp. zg-Y919]MDK1278028.1 class I SAM-dependent methyltransferase [Arthrobacter sp. zg.Y919]WIB03382.1 class I SAM-dependent methyltransferase [Arthrobacter sp. zg-Y919]